MSQYQATLLLGSNLGDQKKNLEHCLQILHSEKIKITAKSKFLFSDPVEFASSNIFCNIAVTIITVLSPIQLLKTIKQIEKEMGREKDSGHNQNYTDRIIDIDIVTYGNIIYFCDKLTIPHGRHLYEREFSKILLESLTLNET